MIYLDYHARAPLRPEAREAMAAAVLLDGNPSSLHAAGRAARHSIEEARTGLAELLQVYPEQVIFTSGGTEANYLALAQAQENQCAVCLIGASEHPGLMEAAHAQPVPVKILPVDEGGGIAPEALANALAHHPAPAFVSIMLANHETGRVQPVAELAAITHKAGGLFHCDAVQGFGKLPFSLPGLGVDFLSLASAKIGGPPGCGALLSAEGRPLRPLFVGGQERGQRAGSENLIGIAGFAAAAHKAVAGLSAFARLEALRDDLEVSVRRHFPGARFFAAGAERLANVSAFTLPGLEAQQSLIMLDLAGICLSAGAACASGKNTPSPVLTAMGASPGEARAALRASLGWASKPADIAAFDQALGAIARRRAA